MRNTIKATSPPAATSGGLRQRVVEALAIWGAKEGLTWLFRWWF